MLLIQTLLLLCHFSFAQTYSIPKLERSETLGQEKVYIYSQDILIDIKGVDSQSEQTKLTNQAIKEGRNQISGLAITRVRTETSLKVSEDQNGEHKESFDQKIHEVSDASVTAKILSQTVSGHYLELKIEYTAKPNMGALSTKIIITPKVAHLFHPGVTTADGVTDLYTYFADPLSGQPGNRIVTNFCISDQQAKSQEFMDRLCQLAGLEKSLGHNADGPMPKKIKNIYTKGKTVTWEEYVGIVREKYPEKLICSDLFYYTKKKVKFDEDSLSLERPYVVEIKKGYSFLRSITCQ